MLRHAAFSSGLQKSCSVMLFIATVSVAAGMKLVLWSKQSNASKIMIYGLWKNIFIDK
ncbi:hypothetical protein MMC2321_02837 [Chitinophaga sp. MM2321]